MRGKIISEELVNLLRALLAASTVWLAYQLVAQQLLNQQQIL
jgi:hypothetical protein